MIAEYPRAGVTGRFNAAAEAALSTTELGSASCNCLLFVTVVITDVIYAAALSFNMSLNCCCTLSALNMFFIAGTFPAISYKYF